MLHQQLTAQRQVAGQRERQLEGLLNAERERSHRSAAASAAELRERDALLHDQQVRHSTVQ
eukprot:5272044-Pyramimonas_sp.AAC.1